MRLDWERVAYCWAMTEPLRPEPMMQLSYFLVKMSLLCFLEDDWFIVLEDVRRLLGVDDDGILSCWMSM